MTEKTIAFQLRWNDAGCPLKDIPGDAMIIIKVSGEGCPPQPRTDVATQEEARPIKEVYVEGNRAGLQALGKIILAVAETDLAGYHEHLDSETYPTFLASDEGWWLTIGLTKARRSNNPK
jgi:hypothetical protein